MLKTETTRSKQLLNKVYDHLDTIDVSKLSMSEMKDFLEVVQKGQFLESYGQVSPYSFGYCAAPFNGSSLGQESAEADGGDDTIASDK